MEEDKSDDEIYGKDSISYEQNSTRIDESRINEIISPEPPKKIVIPERDKDSSLAEDVKLTDADIDTIENEIARAEKGLLRKLEENQVNERGVYLAVIVSILFITICLFINRAERVV